MPDNEHRLPKAEAIDRVWELAKSIEICMFTTWDGEHQRARPLAARPDRDQGRIYFLVDAAGAKNAQIDRFPVVTLAFADTRAHDYVTITGKATVTNDRARIKALWSAFDKAWWDSADDPDIRLIAVEPDDAEIWDGPNRLAAISAMLAAAVTGSKAEFGANQKVDTL